MVTPPLEEGATTFGKERIICAIQLYDSEPAEQKERRRSRCARCTLFDRFCQASPARVTHTFFIILSYRRRPQAWI